MLSRQDYLVRWRKSPKPSLDRNRRLCAEAGLHFRFWYASVLLPVAARTTQQPLCTIECIGRSCKWNLMTRLQTFSQFISFRTTRVAQRCSHPLPELEIVGSQVVCPTTNSTSFVTSSSWIRVLRSFVTTTVPSCLSITSWSGFSATRLAS